MIKTVRVLLASLVESFLVLPGHLRHAFAGMDRSAVSPLRQRLDDGFERFRENVFRPMVSACVRNSWTTVCATIALLMLAVGLVAGGRVPFNFFPSPEATVLNATVNFVAGTPPERGAAWPPRPASPALPAAPRRP